MLPPKQREEKMAKAYFVVRATVADAAKRKAFDTWYQTEHLPDATKSFGANKAWRFWSTTDPSLHQATYEFSDEASLDRAMKGEDLKRLIADFNRDWPDVTRTRELLVLAGEFGA
jgi:2,4-dienoyl-CoA reductase-like NADH-dependent reductase (Old Yellow Enzyme family)